MSWDVWLEADTGGEEPARLDVLDWNYTSNVHGMLKLVMGHGSMEILTGLSGQEAGELLDQAICGLEVDEAACRELNPSNGWGEYEGFLRAVRKLRDACVAHPKATVGTWC